MSQPERQCDFVRRVWPQCNGDYDKAARLYASAEAKGLVRRMSNKNDLSSLEYGRAVVKNWVRKYNL